MTFKAGDAYSLYYKESSSSDYVQYSSSSIYEGSSTLLGLKEGTYDIKLSLSENESQEIKGIQVGSYDRSGYAHFGATSGIGAYNNDGTLKDNAVVVYVNNENKNTVQASIGGSPRVGLSEILKYQYKSQYPLDIRLQGVISTNQFAKKSLEKGEVPFDHPEYYENQLESTYSSNIKGLRCKAWGTSDAKTYWDLTAKENTGYVYEYTTKTTSGDTDSYFNMMDVSSSSNITIEGVTPDATIEQWGFTFSTCNSIEVRNILFENYVEDACSFQGHSNTDMDYKGFWVHNCRFNRGLNNWDMTEEQDKGDGDGGFDLKYLKNVTSSNNIFYNTHKTGLVGGGDSQYTMNITFHHNLYDKCSARLPLGRQANMHFYNNYYRDCGTCQDIRSHSYTFSEANYFSSCEYPNKISSNAKIKSFGDIFSNCKNKSVASEVSSRETEISNTCKPDGSTDCSSFTTDASLFYYDATNKRSDVENLLSANDVPDFVLSNSGNSIKGN